MVNIVKEDWEWERRVENKILVGILFSFFFFFFFFVLGNLSIKNEFFLKLEENGNLEIDLLVSFAF